MPLTILVADDHDAHRDLVCANLRQSSYALIECRNGAETVAITKQWAPDLVIMELSMPIMDGIEAWRMIKELMHAPPPVIALTATNIRDVHHTCKEIGFGAYLTKPVDFTELTSAIDRLARRPANAA